MITARLTYRLPGALGIVTLSPSVLNHMVEHKQFKWLSKEAGGQLFAAFDTATAMQIVDVTGPRPTDKRSLYNYEPDRHAEKVEIKERFERGLHFVGDWHTHKQRIPKPSGTDLYNINEMVRLSRHDLAGFLLIVVGQEEFPAGLHVSFHGKTSSTVLEPMGNDQP